MSSLVCVHGVPDITQEMIPDFRLTPETADRAALLTAIGSVDLVAVILDIDTPTAFSLIVAIRELKPQLAIIGVTAKNDAKHVIEASRNGCSQVTTRPIDPNDLTIALRRALGTHLGSEQSAQTIALLGTRGGSGCTLLACHIGVELAVASREPTALFDLDLEFGGVAQAFDIEPKFTIADLAQVGEPDAIVFKKAGHQVINNLHMFARPHEINEAHALNEVAMAQVLNAARGLYKHLVIDLPPYLTPVTGVAIERSDRLLVVVQLTVPSLTNAGRLLDALHHEGVNEDRIDIVVNRYKKGTHRCSIEMVEEKLGRQVLAIVPSDYQAVRIATDSGRLLPERNPVRTAIRELAGKLSGERREVPKGWLSKLGLGR